jgi:hypothetical protein
MHHTTTTTDLHTFPAPGPFRPAGEAIPPRPTGRDRGIPLHRNPALRPGLAALTAWLMNECYSSYAVGRIFDHMAVHGTLAGCMLLDPRDEAGAEEAFVNGLAAVSMESSAWDREQGVYLDVELMAAGTHPCPVALTPPELEDLDDFDGPDGPDAAWYHPSSPNHPALRAAGLAPISGGSPEPSEADWLDYSEWSRTLEARRWCDQHPLAEFNAVRPD